MPRTSTVGCVLVAAGSGTRLGADRPKALVELAGQALLTHALRRLRAGGVAGPVVVVAPAQWLEQAERCAHAPGTERTSRPPRISVVAGGPERQDSVAAGLSVLPDDVEHVLVHDAARCLAPPALVTRVADAVLAGHPAVVPAIPVADTIKRVRPARAATDVEAVVETVDRAELRVAQTPQGFGVATLRAAHRAGREEGARAPAPLVEPTGAGSTAAVTPTSTDDAALVEIVADVVVVPGDPLAFKITNPQDLAYAEWLLSHGGAVTP